MRFVGDIFSWHDVNHGVGEPIESTSISLRRLYFGHSIQVCHSVSKAFSTAAITFTLQPLLTQVSCSYGRNRAAKWARMISATGCLLATMSTNEGGKVVGHFQTFAICGWAFLQARCVVLKESSANRHTERGFIISNPCGSVSRSGLIASSRAAKGDSMRASASGPGLVNRMASSVFSAGHLSMGLWCSMPVIPWSSDRDWATSEQVMLTPMVPDCPIEHRLRMKMAHARKK